MSALSGRDWSVWEQIDDIVGLALNRATSAYIGYIDTDVQLARNYQAIASQLARVKQLTGSHVRNGDAVPSDLVGSPEYLVIDAALAPMVDDVDVQDAINRLPFPAPSEPSSPDTYGLDTMTGKPSPMTTVVVIGAIVAAVAVGYWYVRGR